jgi:hypothetical protein
MSNENPLRNRDPNKPIPHPLPNSVPKLLAKRILKHERTLNDQIEDILVQLYDDVELQRYLNAVYDEDAVEGSLAIDNGEAARIIRNWAQKNDRSEVAGKKLATIVKSMNTVLRRYEESRRERRDKVRGEIVHSSNNGGE